MPDTAIESGNNRALSILVICVALLLLIRNTGLYPAVFADEYVYSKFARLISFKEVSIPGYIYFFIYKSTSLCRDGFLDCARILNVVFFVSAAPFIYYIARQITGKRSAVLIAGLAILGPINSYTAYFMPESLYFFSFWLFTYVALKAEKHHTCSHWIIMGALFGITALVKPHALFLIPALSIYFFVMLYVPFEGKSKQSSHIKYFGFFASAASSKLIIGFAFAGISGITLFGTTYASLASGSMGAVNHYFGLLRLALDNLLGHLLALSLLFAVPIASLLVSPVSLSWRDPKQRVSAKLALYTSLVLIFLLIVVALFTASVSDHGPYESNVRLHMRYYNFAFPLLLLAAASQLSPKAPVASLTSRAIAGIPLGAAICYAVYTQLAPYVPSFVDNPEVRGFTFNPVAFYLLSGIAFLSLALWIYAARSGALVFMYLFMPLAVGLSSFYVNQELRRHLVADVADEAGLFTKRYLSHDDVSKVLVVGSEPAGLFRALFHLDSPKASLETIPTGATFDLSKLPADKEWVLMIGDHSLPDDTFYQLPMNGFTLARASGPDNIDFKQAAWPGVISSARGLSSAEPWGTWSASDVVTFQFSTPLPQRFKVHLAAHAFGPNVGKEFVAHVGDSDVRFTLGADAEARVLEFDNPKKSKTLSIDVPLPVSPKELGLSSDQRRLGIGFVEMKITPLQSEARRKSDCAPAGHGCRE